MIYKHILSLFLLLAFTGCMEKTLDERVEIVSRWENGAKKTVSTFIGEGSEEKILREELYTSDGTLFKVIDHEKNKTLKLPDLYNFKPNKVLSGKWIGSEENSSYSRFDTLYIQGDKLMSIITLSRENSTNQIISNSLIRESPSGETILLLLDEKNEYSYSNGDIQRDVLTLSNIEFNELSPDGKMIIHDYRAGDYSGDKETQDTIEGDYFDINLGFVGDSLVIESPDGERRFVKVE